MKYDILNTKTKRVQFTAEIDCGVDASDEFKRGLAVKWAIENKANLRGANLRGADLRGANLRGANLIEAYLRGADLSEAYLIVANLRGANLRGANLCGADLRWADLRGADLRGANLCGADLSGVNLRGADLSGANLSEANLIGADLRDVKIDAAPKIENIHQSVYEAASQEGALDMKYWHHPCGTTHCRAGWVVTLAGDEGKKLEHKTGTSIAAALIYMASDPKLEKIPSFCCGNEEALEDMKRLADKERLEKQTAA